MKCEHCRRDVDVLQDEIFIMPQGHQVQLTKACDDCISVLRQYIENYLCAASN